MKVSIIKIAIIAMLLGPSVSMADLDDLNRRIQDGSFVTGSRHSNRNEYRNDYRELEAQTYRQRMQDDTQIRYNERRRNDFNGKMRDMQNGINSW